MADSGIPCFLLLSTAILLCSTQTALTQDVKILPAGDDHVRAIGETILFTCTLQDAQELKWKDKSNKQVTTDTDDRSARVFVEVDGSDTLKLYITSIEEEDKGEYTCEGKVNGQTVSKTVVLVLFKDITFVAADLMQTPMIHTDGLVQCVVESSPEPIVSWRYKGQKVETGGRYIVSPEGLTIKDITREDDGVYECRAEMTEKGRYDKREITVEVHIPPKITKELGVDNEGVEGDRVILSCAASGLPLPKFKFYKGNDLVETANGRTVDAEAGTITFDPVERENDGEYKCTAFNDVGEEDTVGRLIVNIKPNVIELVDVTGAENQREVVVCKVEGHPDTVMSFQKEGNPEPYQMGANEDRIEVRSQRPNELELVINSLQNTDAGNYTCRAENKAGKTSETAVLKVLYGPRFPEQPETYYAWAGATRRITCSAEAEPAPNFVWRHNGKTVPNAQQSDVYSVINEGKVSHLEIVCEERDYGMIFGAYECIAENGYGRKSKNFELDRAMPPGIPQDILIADDSPTSVTLRVVPPKDGGGMPILSYRVEYDADEVLYEMKTDTVGDEEVDIEILNLQPSKNYKFLVSARNEVGTGTALPKAHTTDSVSKPRPIVPLEKEENIGSHYYVAEWKAPKDGGSPITSYSFDVREVEYDKNNTPTPKSDPEVIEVLDSETQPIMSYRVSNLKPYTNYMITITATNSLGKSDPSQPVYFKTAKGAGKEGISSGGLTTPGIVGIIIGLFILFLIIVDVACYFVNNCGVTKCICVSVCGESESQPEQKLVDPEKGEGTDNKTGPAPEAKATSEQETSPLQAEEAVPSESMPLAQPDIHAEIPVERFAEPADTNNEDDADDVNETTPLAGNEAKC